LYGAVRSLFAIFPGLSARFCSVFKFFFVIPCGSFAVLDFSGLYGSFLRLLIFWASISAADFVFGVRRPAHPGPDVALGNRTT